MAIYRLFATHTMRNSKLIPTEDKNVLNFLIWGTGKETRKILEFEKELKGELIGFVQTVRDKDYFEGKAVYKLEDLDTLEYDLILITPVLCANEIYRHAINSGLTEEKLCFLHRPIEFSVDINKNLAKLAKILPEKMLIDIEGYKGNGAFDFILKDLKMYNSLNKRAEFRYKDEYKDFWYYDKYAKAGSIENYFWQDLWAARLIYKNRAAMHYDIGSRVDGFISHLLSFGQDVTLIDVRPLDQKVEGVQFVHSDATELSGIEDESIESISALCSLEHFGLGRYGDPIDPEACFKAFEAINRKVKRGGRVFISVPIGQDHVEFNGCRIFYAETIKNAFKEMELVEFSTTHHGKIEYNADIHSWDDFSQRHGVCYGLFYFKKR